MASAVQLLLTAIVCVSRQYSIYWNRALPYWSRGEWNGNIFAGIPEMTSHYIYNFEFVSNANTSYFTYSLQDPTIISRLVVSISGQVTQLTWMPSADEWILICCFHQPYTYFPPMKPSPSSTRFLLFIDRLPKLLPIPRVYFYLLEINQILDF
ncbi:hypothetical protein ABZP36_012582 [Zizania latifolia]